MADVNTNGRYKVKRKNGDICLSRDENKEFMRNGLCENDVKLYVKRFLIEYYKGKSITIRVAADQELLPFIAKIIATIEK